MNSGEKTTASSSANAAPTPPTAPSLNLDDVVFTLFRHKWLILAFVCLGLAAMEVARVRRPPLYESHAKLMVRYVVDTKAVNPANPNTSIEQDLSQNVINSEMEILDSLDVAARAADKVG